MTPPRRRRIKRIEDGLQAAICRYLAHALPLTAWYCSIPNGAVLAGDKEQRARQMHRMKAMGLRVGAPDIFIVWQGKFIGLEVKTATGQLEKSQRDASDAITLAGGLWSVVRSIDEVEAFLSMLGMPLKARAQ